MNLFALRRIAQLEQRSLNESSALLIGVLETYTAQT